MENLGCCGRHEGAEVAGWPSSSSLLNTNESKNMFRSTQLPTNFESYWPSIGGGFCDDGAATASCSKSHSEAEKRRRGRINEQLQILRKLIPKSEKMDKAALLASVIEHVKDLKSKAAEVVKHYTVPTDVDDVRISSCLGNIFIEASLCCEDRPELFGELDKTLQNLKLSIIRAEIASLGQRVHIQLLLSNSGNQNGDLESTTLKQTLRAALNRVVNSSQSVTSYRVASKRHRFFMPRADC